MTPGPVDGVPYWAVNSVIDEAGSTHLWIVDRAVDTVGQRLDLPGAASAHARMTDAACKARWQQGLYDADYRKQYNGGWFDLSPSSSTATIAASGATWQAHFYDPDTGKNYKGNTSPTAKTEALAHLAQAKAKLAAKNVKDGCYSLGLALHFLTDLTQPMHASNFAATDWPLKLHSNYEEYALRLQSSAMSVSWNGPPAEAVAPFIDGVGRRAKSRWAGQKAAIAAAYGARCDAFDSYYLDHTECWQNDPGVDAATVAAMSAAVADTASFLAIAQLP
jgi:phospholipase C